MLSRDTTSRRAPGRPHDADENLRLQIDGLRDIVRNGGTPFRVRFPMEG